MPKKMTMKCLMLILPLVLGGCTSTKLVTEKWTLKRVSFLQKVEIPSLKMNAEGEATLSGYVNDGGNEALSAVTAAAVKAAIHSIKP